MLDLKHHMHWGLIDHAQHRLDNLKYMHNETSQ